MTNSQKMAQAQKTLDKAFEKIKNNPEAMKKSLINAGIITKTGKLASRYK